MYQSLHELDVAPVASPHQGHPTLIILAIHIGPEIHQLEDDRQQASERSANGRTNKQTDKQINKQQTKTYKHRHVVFVKLRFV